MLLKNLRMLPVIAISKPLKYSIMKKLKFALFPLLAALTLSSCSENEEPFVADPTTTATTGAYIINQGNYYEGVSGSVDVLNLSDGAYSRNAFRAANGQSVGDSPQAAEVYGSKVYIPVYASNLVWVLERSTLKILARIEMQEPEDVCAAEGYVFVSNNDGYVSRIDTVSLTTDRHVAVGPNPAQLTATNGQVFVSISDGYNYNGGYANGKRIAVLDVKTGEKVKDITVGLNPGPICADAAGNVFVVCRGNYADVPAKVQRIAAGADVAANFAEGNLIATDGERLCVIATETDWVAYKTLVTSRSYDTTTGALLKDELLDAAHLPGNPLSVDIDPQTGRLYVCSDQSPADYDKAGRLFVYESDGTFVAVHETGIHPHAVVFF